MSTFFTVLFFLLGAFAFSFVLWKKLREDYSNEEIFKFTIFIFIGLLIGWWIAVSFARDFSFWLTILVPFVLGTYVHRRLGLKFFELIDALSPAWFSFLFFSYSGVFISHLIHLNSLSIKTPTWFVIGEIILSIASILLYRFLLARYRRFSWYPSGKVGFAGLASLSIYFIARSLFEAVASFVSPTLLVSLGKINLSIEVVDAIMGIVLAGVALFVLYSRSGRKK